jgi:probable rRNA maturation factor
MELIINVTNEKNKIKLNNEINELIQSVIKTVLEIHNIDFDVEISLLLTDDEEIKQINKEYRGIDKATDVLSFPSCEFEKEGVVLKEYYPSEGGYPYLLLGDIIISVEHVLKQAQEFGHTNEREIGYLVCHSMLHLLGYDHMEEEEKKIMRTKEEEVMKILGVERK